jgi:hypothetical protein
MNAQEQTKINIIPQGGELIIRHGKAEEIVYPKDVVINGTLGAPFQFLQGRGELDEKQIHLLIDTNNSQIQLVIGDVDPHTTHTIAGSLSFNPELTAFKINTAYRWSVRDFIKFCRERKFFFNNHTEHAKLVDGLMKWSANIETLVKEFNDQKGNSLFQLETRVKKADGFIESFTLSVPIFQGYPKLVFKVEIGLDPKHTGVDLFLISDELMTLIYQERERIIAEEVKKFDKYSFSKVVIS